MVLFCNISDSSNGTINFVVLTPIITPLLWGVDTKLALISFGKIVAKWNYKITFKCNKKGAFFLTSYHSLPFHPPDLSVFPHLVYPVSGMDSLPLQVGVVPSLRSLWKTVLYKVYSLHTCQQDCQNHLVSTKVTHDFQYKVAIISVSDSSLRLKI